MCLCSKCMNRLGLVLHHLANERVLRRTSGLFSSTSWRRYESQALRRAVSNTMKHRCQSSHTAEEGFSVTGSSSILRKCRAMPNSALMVRLKTQELGRQWRKRLPSVPAVKRDCFCVNRTAKDRSRSRLRLGMCSLVSPDPKNSTTSTRGNRMQYKKFTDEGED